MKTSVHLHACVLLSVLSPALRGEVLDVRGPTPDFDEIADAVAAADDGDVVRVFAGSYQPFSVVDKDLSVVRAEIGAAVRVLGTIRIAGLAAGCSVELTGIDGLAQYVAGWSEPAPHGLWIEDCAGSVRVRDGEFAGGQQGFQGVGGVHVEDSADVELVQCSTVGGFPASDEYGGWGGHGLTASHAFVSIFRSVCTGHPGGVEDDPGGSGGSGGAGIDAFGGRVYVSGCTLVGGDGAPADPEPDLWTGDYGYGGDGGWGFHGGGSVEAYFLDVAFSPGSGGWAPVGGHHGADGQDHTPGTELPGSARVLRSSSITPDFEPLGLRFEGAPGDVVYLRVALEPAYAFDPRLGPLLIDGPAAPAAAPWRRVGVLPPSGVLLASQTLADLPAFDHRTLHLQAIFAGSERYYGSSSWSVVLDGAW